MVDEAFAQNHQKSKFKVLIYQSNSKSINILSEIGNSFNKLTDISLPMEKKDLPFDFKLLDR